MAVGRITAERLREVLDYDPQDGRLRWRRQRGTTSGINGRMRHLGLFDTPEDAHDAYLNAKRQVHPFWPGLEVAR